MRYRGGPPALRSGGGAVVRGRCRPAALRYVGSVVLDCSRAHLSLLVHGGRRRFAQRSFDAKARCNGFGPVAPRPRRRRECLQNSGLRALSGALVPMARHSGTGAARHLGQGPM